MFKKFIKATIVGLPQKEFKCKCEEMFEKDQFGNYAIYRDILVDQIKKNILPKGCSVILFKVYNN